MKEETEKLWKQIEQIKSQRPACLNQDNDWKHTFVNYHTEGIRKCLDCDYTEDIVIGVFEE